MAEGKSKAWTEAEKLSVLFQIIETAPIPWDSLTLPDGRTKKAVQVMLDREKTKMKKAREAVGRENEDGKQTIKGETAGKAKGKRKVADGEAGDKSKKAKRAKNTKTKAGEDTEEKGREEDDTVAAAEGVKAEPAEEED